MTERGKTPNKNRLPRRFVGLGAAGLAVASFVYFFPQLNENNERNLKAGVSNITSGVTGQIEGYDTAEEWVDNIPLGTTYVPGYTLQHQWLLIEQCPEDIAAAQQGESTKSFDPEVNVYGADCAVDWVGIDGLDASQFTIGEEITFAGPIGQKLSK